MPANVFSSTFTVFVSGSWIWSRANRKAEEAVHREGRGSVRRLFALRAPQRPSESPAPVWPSADQRDRGSASHRSGGRAI